MHVYAFTFMHHASFYPYVLDSLIFWQLIKHVLFFLVIGQEEEEENDKLDEFHEINCQNIIKSK
jgi:hypothetical protein